MKSLLTFEFPVCPRCESDICYYLNQKLAFECGSEYYAHADGRFNLGRPCRTPIVALQQAVEEELWNRNLRKDQNEKET